MRVALLVGLMIVGSGGLRVAQAFDDDFPPPPPPARASAESASFDDDFPPPPPPAA